MKTPRSRAPARVAPVEPEVTEAEYSEPEERPAPAPRRDAPRGKLKKQRLTGLFRKENSFGVYWTGQLEDGTQVIVHDPFERKPDGPDLVLSRLVPGDTEHGG